MRLAPKLVVFDWDGTLSDSSDRIVSCFRHALAAVGADTDIADAAIRETIGLELSEAAPRIMVGASAAQCDALTEAYRRHWLSPGAPQAVLFDDTLPCLRSLSQRGLTLTVATGKSRRGLDRELGETGLAPYFSSTRTADETRGKPHPQMLHELLAHAGVRADEALMVGDTTFDLDMANAAGVPSVGIASGTHSRSRLEASGPVACLDRLGQLLGLFG